MDELTRKQQRLEEIRREKAELDRQIKENQRQIDAARRRQRQIRGEQDMN